MKIGKTEFCTQCPDALILATEIGTNGRPGAMVQPIATYSDFKLVLRQLEKPEVKAKFSTICIDTIGILYDLAEQYICAQNSVQKIGDIPYGGGYSALSKEFETSLRKITMMSYGLIMTSHLKEITNDDGKIVGYKPDLNARCLKIVNGLVDIIGVITKDWKEDGTCERWIITRSTPTITAGSRYKYLAPKIPFGYKEFTDALGDAIQKECDNGAVVVDSIPIIDAEEVSFTDVRAEMLELWTKLVGTGEAANQEMAKTILKKAEIIFGRQIKLSEITEDQLQLACLVLDEMRELDK